MNKYNLPEDKAKIFQELIDQLNIGLNLTEKSLIEIVSNLAAANNVEEIL